MIASETPERMVATMSRTFHESLDVATTVETIARQFTDTLSDWCVIDLVDDLGGIRREAVAMSAPVARDAMAERLRAGLFEWAPDPQKPRGVQRVLDTRAPVLLPVMTEEILRRSARGHDHLELMRTFGLTSYVCVPLLVGERVLGTIMCMLSVSPGQYGQADIPLLQQLADHAALAVDHALRHTQALADLDKLRTLLATTSHDLRNAVGPILLSCQLLERSAVHNGGAPPERYLTIVRRWAQFIERLGAGLLGAFAESQSSDLDLSDLAASCVALLAPLAEERGVRLDLKHPNPPVYVRGGRGKIEQIVLNLLGNGIKFTPDGGKVTVQVCPTLQGEGAILRIQDSGFGIPKDDVPHLFERGWRGGKSPDGSHGLGLWITKLLVDSMGGNLGVESEPGKGSNFWVHFPSAASTA